MDFASYISGTKCLSAVLRLRPLVPIAKMARRSSLDIFHLIEVSPIALCLHVVAMDEP